LAAAGNVLGAVPFMQQASFDSALRADPETYLLAAAGKYRSELGNILADPSSGLRVLLRRHDLSIPELQRQILIALVRLTRAHTLTPTALEDMVDLMDHVTPAANEVAGTLNQRPLLLPKLFWTKSMLSKLASFKTALQKLPGTVLNDRMDNLIKRRTILTSDQMA
jgi:hypothetical protein